MQNRKTNRLSTLIPILLAASYFICVGSVWADVVVSEIMYHPASEAEQDEYIEILNNGNKTIEMAGWRFTDAVNFVFPDVALAPGNYLVVAANKSSFTALYPGVTNVVGDWTGRLSNKSEQVELRDRWDKKVEQFSYADEGDWAERHVGPMDDGHDGWVWATLHDGGGRSLELRNPTMSRKYGKNWAASLADGGTPGQANSTALSASAPFILDVAHAPLIPDSSSTVTVSARIKDDFTASVQAFVYYRLDGASSFSSLLMQHDGEDGYSAILPPQEDRSVVEFYIEATDTNSLQSTWPEPTKPDETQSANALYLVDDVYDASAVWTSVTQPTYYLIMTEIERAELASIGSGNGEDSNAQMNGTFISIEESGVRVRYQAGFRNRGHGSRDGPPNNFRVNFPHDNTWHGLSAININCRTPYAQHIGAMMHQMIGGESADTQEVQLRVNGANLAESGSLMYGSYVSVEPLASDFAEAHFPGNGQGNLYKCLRSDLNSTEADLRWLGTDPAPYRLLYFKQTNEEVDDWSDLIGLVQALNNTPDETYFEEVSKVVNIEQWVRYLALDTLFINRETGLNRGYGDDYALYSGDADTRFVLVPHDLDTILGQGNSTGAIDQDIFGFRAVMGLDRFLSHPKIVRMYYQAFVDLTNTTFNSETMRPVFEQELGHWIAASRIESMLNFIDARSQAVLAQIPLDLTVHSNLPITGGYYRSQGQYAALFGEGNAAQTVSILVGGEMEADWSAIDGSWSVGQSKGGSVQTFIPRSAVWRYLDQGVTWSGPGVVESGWPSGQAELGYGDSDEVTVVSYGPSSSSKYITTYFQRTFTVADASEVHDLTARLVRDDGAVVYLNGTELFRSNMPSGAVTYDTRASSAIGGSDEEIFYEYAVDPSFLIDGDNLLSVEIHQSSSTSSDISFNFELIGLSGEVGATNGVSLKPGINRILVQAFDGPSGTGNEIDRTSIDIWYDAQTIPDTPTSVSALRLLTRDSYLPGIPFLVRVEGLDADGNIDRDLWDATVALTTDQPGAITLSTNEVQIYNGLGSALVTATGTGAFTLTAALADQAASRTLTALNITNATALSGTLAGTTTTWSGLIHITGDLLVPVGHTLLVNPGTLVLIDGDPALEGESGIDIDVLGAIRSLGTAQSPVTFTATDPAAPWGELHFSSAAPSRFEYTHVTRAGHAPRGGHTNTGPAFRVIGSSLYFDHAAITDSAGKIMQTDSAGAIGSSLEFHHSLLSRAVMGPELFDTTLLFQDSYILNMLGIYQEDGLPPNDNDGIYLHAALAGQDISLIHSVVANFDDDGIDTASSRVTLREMIIRGAYDKGISESGGSVDIAHCLVTGCDIGIETKLSSAQCIINHSTFVDNVNSVRLMSSASAMSISNSIIWGSTDSVLAETPGDMTITYSNLGEAWTGTGNSTADPLFSNAARGDFRLKLNSPAIDAADPLSPLDPNGSRADMGYRPYEEINVVIIDPDASIIPGGSLTQDTIWTTDGSPYRITGNVTVNAGVTLTIEPGVTLFFATDTSLIVRGRLLAEGTESQPIRFTWVPGSGTWDGVQFDGSMEENHIAYAILEYGITSRGMIGLDNSRLLVEHSVFDHTDLRRIRTQNSSLTVRNSIFTNIFEPGQAPTTNNGNEHIWGAEVPEGGAFILENNQFGTITGHNDCVDFDMTEPDRAMVQIRNNTFLGGGDDALDLVVTSAWIEGNRFYNFHKDSFNTDPGQSNVISASLGHYTVVRNIFYNVQHISLVKENSFMTFINNIVVDAGASGLYFDLEGQTSGPGEGAFVDGSIFYNTPIAFDLSVASATFEAHHSIVPPADIASGLGNLAGDPLLVNPGKRNFNLLPGSPAIGTGPNGIDMGAMVSAGASISGEPVPATASGAATLTIGGPGITHYRYRLTGGTWQAEQPVSMPITLTGLGIGTHSIEVVGKNLPGIWQEEANATISKTWAVISAASFAYLRVSELNYNPSAPTIDELFADPAIDSDDFEFIEFVNTGSTTINIAGIHAETGIQFALDPMLTIPLDPGEHAVMVRDAEAFIMRYGNTPRILGEYEGKLSNSGEHVLIFDALGMVLADIDYNDGGSWPQRADGGGSSLELKNNIAGSRLYDDPDMWRSSQEYNGSPGLAGVQLRNIVINEVLTHTDPPNFDAIELLNTSGQTIAIGGWLLSDSSGNYFKFSIPVGMELLPGAFTFFDENDFNPTPLTPHESHFALNGSHGEDVYLLATDAEGKPTRFMDHIRFGGAANGESFGRWPDGAGDPNDEEALAPMLDITLGAPNSAPRVGPVILSEVHYAPSASQGMEFVEIFNPTTETINLTDWRIRKGIDFDFVPSTMLPPSGVLVVVPFDPVDPTSRSIFLAAYGLSEPVALAGPFSGRLDNSGDRVQLQRPDAPPTEEPTFTPHLVEDEAKFQTQSPWPQIVTGYSLARLSPLAFGNSPSSWKIAPPSPGTYGDDTPFAPIIYVHPVSRSVRHDTSATFSVSAIGSAPLQYQWMKDNIPIPQASAATLTLLSVQDSDEGVYTCQVENTTGQTLSDPATLRIKEAQEEATMWIIR